MKCSIVVTIPENELKKIVNEQVKKQIRDMTDRLNYKIKKVKELKESLDKFPDVNELHTAIDYHRRLKKLEKKHKIINPNWRYEE